MSSNEHEYQRKASYQDYSIDLGKVYYQRIIQSVAAFGAKTPDKKLLDIGCFDGTLAAQFLPAWEAYGLEGNVAACEKARGKGVKAVLHDLEKRLPFEDGSFDCVIAAEIIEHVYDTDFFLEEIRRVMKKNGLLVLSTPNIACLTNRVRLLFGLYPRYAEYRAGGAGHIRIYTSKTIRGQIAEKGFEILRYAGCNLPLAMHHPLVPQWLKRFAVKGGDYFPSLAGQVVITARLSLKENLR
jgi:SAM-dependent methyltransferase